MAMWRDEYVRIAARETSACPFCPEDIYPGDAITQRRPGEPCCHIGCAYEEDEREEEDHDLPTHLAASYRMRRRVRRDFHGRKRRRAGLRPLKRKQRVKV